MYYVYEITNQVNGKKYVGITGRSVAERFSEHKSRAMCQQRDNRLYAAMRKHGVENFTVELVDSTESEQVARELETAHINRLDSYSHGYNCNLGGHGLLVVTDAIREKIGRANRGRVIGERGRKNMAAAKAGDKSCAKNFGEYTSKGNLNPKSKTYTVRNPEGTEIVITGMRSFCREVGINFGQLLAKGKAKGYVLVGRFNDYPEREYAQAGGSAHLPTR